MTENYYSEEKIVTEELEIIIRRKPKTGSKVSYQSFQQPSISKDILGATPFKIIYEASREIKAASEVMSSVSEAAARSLLQTLQGDRPSIISSVRRYSVPETIRPAFEQGLEEVITQPTTYEEKSWTASVYRLHAIADKIVPYENYYLHRRRIRGETIGSTI